MKTLIIVLLVLVCCAIVFLTYSLIYPLPSTVSSFDGPDINETYFINKILFNHISPQSDNKLVITEDELNGYIAYRLKDQGYSIENFIINHGEVKLLEQELIFTGFGKYSIFPVKLEVHLIPNFQQDILNFTVEKLKLSKLNIPKRLINKFYDSSLYSLPLNKLDMIQLENIMFLKGEAVIRYRIDKDKLLEQIIKGLTKQTNP